MKVSERQLEEELIEKLEGLKYVYRADIQDRVSLEQNFREKFEALNRVKLTDSEFYRLLDEIVTHDVFKAAQLLRSINSFRREDGTPLNYTLVNLKDWCKNHFEVIHQLRINTDNSHHRYDGIFHQRSARGADRAEDLRHQTPPGYRAGRRIQERRRQWLHEGAALFHAAFHRWRSRLSCKHL